MSAPLQFWNKRVSEVGSGLEGRRLFFTSLDASLSKAQDTCNAGLYPVMSFKTGGYSWAHVASGDADAALQAWGCLWNADLNTVTVLSGDRLMAFRKALAAW